MHYVPVAPPHPPTTAIFRNFKKSTALCKVHNMGLRYIKSYSVYILYVVNCMVTRLYLTVRPSTQIREDFNICVNPCNACYVFLKCAVYH